LRANDPASLRNFCAPLKQLLARIHGCAHLPHLPFEFGNNYGSVTIKAMSALTQTPMEEIKSAPEPVQQEVLNFSGFS